MKRFKLFCLPYAGGSKTIYADFQKKLCDLVEVVPLEYSGHGSRYGKSLFNNADDTVNDIFQILKSSCCTKYMIFGHSLGALIAYETVARFSSLLNTPPCRLIVAGNRPPHLMYKDKKYNGLHKDDVMDAIFELGYMPSEILMNKELYDIYIDIIFADIQIINNYHFVNRGKLNIPITAMRGSDDNETPKKDMLEWRNLTKEFDLITIHGDHFFPFSGIGFFDKLRDVIKKQ